MVELSVRAEEITTASIGASATTSVNVDLAGAKFSKGKLACVVAGKQLEVAGTTSAAGFIASGRRHCLGQEPIAACCCISLTTLCKRVMSCNQKGRFGLILIEIDN